MGDEKRGNHEQPGPEGEEEQGFGTPKAEETA
jgi:hypothetical protein